jgi:transcriptional regulator with XRE-family HTH domain
MECAMQSRIRDVRRAKGLTLADVAERCNPPTTAQTIGRLETGMRVLSLIWINRIADALGVDSSDLVALPEQQFLPVAAVLQEDGTYAPAQAERMMVPNVGGRMVGLRVAAAMGEYRRGDELWLEQLQPDDFSSALNWMSLCRDRADGSSLAACLAVTQASSTFCRWRQAHVNRS